MHHFSKHTRPLNWILKRTKLDMFPSMEHITLGLTSQLSTWTHCDLSLDLYKGVVEPSTTLRTVS